MNFSERHAFAVGKAFAIQENVSAQDYLAVARDAEKTIALHAVEQDGLLFWKDEMQAPAEKTDVSLGYGTAGVAYFYLLLHAVTKDESYTAIIKKSLSYVALHWKDMIPRTTRYPWPDGMHFGFYGGISGIGCVLLLAWKQFGWSFLWQAIEDIRAYLEKTAQEKDGGFVWTASPTTLSDGGILLFLVALYEAKPTESCKALLEKAGKGFLSLGIPHGDGLEFSDFETCKLSEPNYPYAVSQPNFELGSAGAGFVLTRLYQALGDKQYVQAAKRVAQYLATVKKAQTKGFLLPYRVGEPLEPFFYLGNCHGVAGTVKFYYNLYKTTGEKAYLADVHALFDGFESLGAPRTMSKGFWNNVSVCCGHGGVVNTATGLFQATNEPRWHALAQTAAAILLGERDKGAQQECIWTIAYRRIAPTEYSSTIFYNDGIAGIASALLRMYLCEQQAKNPYPLGDDPF